MISNDISTKNLRSSNEHFYTQCHSCTKIKLTKKTTLVLKSNGGHSTVFVQKVRDIYLQADCCIYSSNSKHDRKYFINHEDYFSVKTL